MSTMRIKDAIKVRKLIEIEREDEFLEVYWNKDTPEVKAADSKEINEIFYKALYLNMDLKIMKEKVDNLNGLPLSYLIIMSEGNETEFFRQVNDLIKKTQYDTDKVFELLPQIQKSKDYQEYQTIRSNKSENSLSTLSINPSYRR